MGRREFLKGTIEMVVLSMVKEEDMYGYQILQKLKQVSPELLGVKEGTLYPILQRLQGDGYISGKWVKVGEKRKRHMYTITARGRSQLKDNRVLWDALSRAVNQVIRATA